MVGTLSFEILKKMHVLKNNWKNWKWKILFSKRLIISSLCNFARMKIKVLSHSTEDFYCFLAC